MAKKKTDKHIVHPPAPPASSTPVRHYGGRMDRLTPLDDVDLSVRTANACQNADICTLGELSQHTEAWLHKHTYINGKGIAELRNALSDAGLAFRAEPAPMSLAELRQRRGVLAYSFTNQRAALERTREKMRAVDASICALGEKQHATPLKDANDYILRRAATEAEIRRRDQLVAVEATARRAADFAAHPDVQAVRVERCRAMGMSSVETARRYGITAAQVEALLAALPVHGTVSARGASASPPAPESRRKTKRGA